jgi:hypothetical protein
MDRLLDVGLAPGCPSAVRPLAAASSGSSGPVDSVRTSCDPTVVTSRRALAPGGGVAMSFTTLCVGGMGGRRCLREVTAMLRDIPGVETVVAEAARSFLRLGGTRSATEVLEVLGGSAYAPRLLNAAPPGLRLRIRAGGDQGQTPKDSPGGRLHTALSVASYPLPALGGDTAGVGFRAEGRRPTGDRTRTAVEQPPPEVWSRHPDKPGRTQRKGSARRGIRSERTVSCSERRGWNARSHR